MSFLFTAIKDYVYSGDALATDESATSKNASSSTSEQEEKEMRPPTANPYSSASTKNAERIIVAPPGPPTVTLSVPTFALDTGANSDSDSDSDDSDDDSDADVPKPSAQQTPQLNVAPYGPIATTTLLSAEDLEDATPSFPAVNGPQRLAACSTDPKSKRRIKFALAPGHSPLDWARLTSSGKDLRGVMGMGRYTLADVKLHNKNDDAWTVLNGKVYNMTPYLAFHPGGEKEIMRCAGRDGTRLFNLTHKWVNYEYMLKECQVGFLVSESSSSYQLTA
ncbi:hypothetical protein BGZ74_010658 [Mortierella antarctica]|nr:hypothetical protein BGZ74_010658 [Mortierella antarctica]